MSMNAPVIGPDIELRAIAAVLRRHSRIIALTFAAIFSLAAALAFLLPPAYTATALILVEPAGKNLLEPGATAPPAPGSESARVDSEVEILRSDAIALAVITQKGLMSDPEFGPRPSLLRRLAAPARAAPGQARLLPQTLARFRKAVEVRRRGLTYLISVSVTSRSPERAAELANALAQAHIDAQIRAKSAETLAARDLLQARIMEARQRIAENEARLEAFLEAGLASDDTAGPALAELRASLRRSRQELAGKTRLQSRAEALLEAEDWAGLVEVLEDEGLARLAAQRQALAVSGGAGQRPAAAVLEETLATIDARLNAGAERAMARLADDIRSLDERAAALREDMRQRLLGADLSPQTLARAYALQQETATARAKYQQLLARLSDMETQARLQMADSRIVSPALPPATPSFPDRTLFMLVALAVSAGVGVGLAFVKEYHIGGVTSAQQLSEMLHSPVAATVPEMRQGRGAPRSLADLMIKAPLSPYAESIRKLRATAELSLRPPQGAPRAGGAGRVVVVTSSVGGEGKTTTALSLARAWALAGKSTLVIDADLRKPSLHRHVGAEPAAGLLEYLQSSDPALADAGFHVKDPLSPASLILGSGHSDTPTDQLLSSAMFADLLSKARDFHDIVIIDTPPILPVVDGRYVLAHADAAVLAVRWASTGQREVRAAMQEIAPVLPPQAALLPVLTRCGEGAARYGEGYPATARADALPKSSAS